MALLMVPNLELHLVMVNLVWVLGPLTFNPIENKFGLVVAIFSLQIVRIIHKWFLVMLELLLFLVQPTSAPESCF